MHKDVLQAALPPAGGLEKLTRHSGGGLAYRMQRLGIRESPGCRGDGGCCVADTQDTGCAHREEEEVGEGHRAKIIRNFSSRVLEVA